MKSLRNLFHATRLFQLCVLLPTGLCLLYFAFIYTPKYRAELAILPKNGLTSIATSTVSTFLGGLGESDNTDSNMIQDYLLSPDLLALLDRDLHLRKAFSNPSINYWQRLSPHATQEEFLEFYRDSVRVSLDTSSSILHIQVIGFSPQQTLALANQMLVHAEIFLNDVSRQLASRQIGFVEQELEKNHRNLTEQTQKLLSYQKDHQQLDPTAESISIMGVMGDLESQLAIQKAALIQKSTYLAQDSEPIVTLKNAISALEAEIKSQRNRLTGSDQAGQPGLATSIFDYNEIKMQHDFDSQIYTAAFLALQAAQAEAALSIRTIVVISQPKIIEKPTYPDFSYWTLTAFFLFGLVFGLGWLIYDSIIWHAD